MSDLFSMVLENFSYKLPITNALFLFVFLGFGSSFLLTTNQIKDYAICRSDINLLIPSLEWLNFFISRFVFLDFKNHFFAIVLITIFRNFERIYGSKKFANYMFANFVLATILEFSIINVLKYFDYLNINVLANGCFFYIFSLFINYCKDIPKERFVFFGVNLSEKLLIYFFGFQMMFSSLNIMISCISGILSGIICRSNAFNVCDVIKIPNKFLELLLKLLNTLLLSNKEPECSNNLGATHQDRRQIYIEYYEQTLNDNQNDYQFVDRPSTSFETDESFERNVGILEEMGFDKEKVKLALRRSDNNLNQATAILLEEIN